MTAVFGDSARPFPEPGAKPNYAPSRTTRIAHYDLHLDLFPVERRFTGRARIQIEPMPSFTGDACFDLDEVVVDTVQDSNGKDLAFTHDDAVLTVHEVEAPLTLVVTWHGQDPRLGLYFTGPEPFAPDRQHMAWTQCQDEDGHFFLPSHDHPRIKHPWRITLTGPAGFTLLSNGTQLDRGEADGRAFAVYDQPEPMPTYLLTAVCAQLSVIDAHWRDRSVRYLVPPGEEAYVQRSMGKTPRMMEHFSQITGVDFPWPRYDQVVVHDFVFGGMENVACTTMTDILLVDDKGAWDWDPEGLVAHELAHQWFGDLVTCQDWSQGWLNESWATFMEVVWWEHDRSPADAAWYRYGLASAYIDEDGGRYRRPIVSYHFKNPIDVFDRHLYEKGGMVLTTLRSTLGEDAFWTGVRTYLERHAHSTVHSRHFQRALEDATGRNLDRFFAEWIHGAGHPALEVKLSHSSGLLSVTVKQTQKGDSTAEAFAFPLRLEVIDRDGGSRLIDLPVAERDRTWAIPMDKAPQTVRVDPFFRVLAEIKLAAPRGWLEKLVLDTCPVLSVRAAEALLDDGSQLAFDAVVAAQATHADHHVRAELASLLGKHGGSHARDALLVRLEGEADPRARRAVAAALGNFRERSVADALISALQDDAESWTELGALLKSLGKTRDPRAVEVLKPFLGIDSWAEVVRRGALEGLAATERPEVLDTLLHWSGLDQNQRLRAASASALASLGDAVEKTRRPAAERLVQMLAEPGFRSQVGAITALGALKHPMAIPALEQVHRTAVDGRNRRLAYEAIQSIRKGRTSEEGLAAVRTKLEQLANENAELKQRLSKLESRVEG